MMSLTKSLSFFYAAQTHKETSDVMADGTEPNFQFEFRFTEYILRNSFHNMYLHRNDV